MSFMKRFYVNTYAVIVGQSNYRKIFFQFFLHQDRKGNWV